MRRRTTVNTISASGGGGGSSSGGNFSQWQWEQNQRLASRTNQGSSASGSSTDFASLLSRLQAQQQSVMGGYMSRLNSNLAAQQANQQTANAQRADVYAKIEDEQARQEIDSRRSLLRTQYQQRDTQNNNALMLQRGLTQNAQRRSYQSGLLSGSAKGRTNLTNRMS